MEQIKKILQDRGIRPSHHRIKVLQYLARSDQHPTVEDIHRDLVPQIPTLTKATIYNALRLFVDKGLVSALNLSGDETRFDYKHQIHAHFHCIRCNNIIDIKSKYSCLDLRKIGAHRIQDAQLVFKGICGACQGPGK